MTFLEARKILAGFSGGPPLPLLLAMSGTPESLEFFVRASAARRGLRAEVRTLPFNTLGQWLLSEPAPGEVEAVLLFPWDLVPALDWRSGVAATAPEFADVRDEAAAAIERLASRRARLMYVPAPVPPLFTDPVLDADLTRLLTGLAAAAGASLLPADVFSLASYLASGSPMPGGSLGTVAEMLVERVAAPVAQPAKVLVTDLDEVMWRGLIGEDGLEGIRCDAEGPGYRFFLYQTLLAKLQREGVLLAAVSRNDPELALSPFRAGRTVLREEQFVCILASYNAKSAQVAEISERLNLGLDSFVFVDDNPIELAEVSAQLPSVTSVHFPAREEELPAFFATLAARFARAVVTDEDRERTALYRRRAAGIAPSSTRGADLTAFLRGLRMVLTIHDRSEGERTRAVQLINKTNQFNLNGRRVTDDEVAEMLRGGGRLFTAVLVDRNGAHGEILACLVSADGVVESLVMSCRVFQRRVEHAFLAWLAGQERAPRFLRYQPTERNEPLRRFLEDPAFAVGDGELVRFDSRRFLADHGPQRDLFLLQVPAPPLVTP
jgi:FkbH-like protein